MTKTSATTPEKPSFWTTLPGILTGVAAVLAAVAALLGTGKREPDKTASASPAASAPSATPATGGTTVTVSGNGSVGVGTLSNGTINVGTPSSAPSATTAVNKP